MTVEAIWCFYLALSFGVLGLILIVLAGVILVHHVKEHRHD